MLCPACPAGHLGPIVTAAHASLLCIVWLTYTSGPLAICIATNVRYVHMPTLVWVSTPIGLNAQRVMKGTGGWMIRQAHPAPLHLAIMRFSQNILKRIQSLNPFLFV